MKNAVPDCGKRREIKQKVAPGEKNRKARSGREWVNCDDRKEVREGRVLFILLEKMGIPPRGQRHRHQELHGEALVDTGRPSQTGQNAKVDLGVLLPARQDQRLARPESPPVGSPEEGRRCAGANYALTQPPCRFLSLLSRCGRWMPSLLMRRMYR